MKLADFESQGDSSHEKDNVIRYFLKKMDSVFRFCPNCGSSNHSFTHLKKFECHDCSYVFYKNAAAACAAVLVHGGKILFTVRNQEPGYGKLDLPGGFIDSGETMEDGLRREVLEELGLELGTCEYLTSFPNTYPFKGTTYYTCDQFFVCSIDHLPTSVEETEIQRYVMVNPSEVDMESIAFESIRKGVAYYVEHFKA